MNAALVRLKASLQGTFVRFLIGGVSTTVVSYAAYLLLLPVASYLVAYAAAYAVGIAWSYFANTVFVFRAKPSLGRALAFPLVYLVQFLVGSALLVLLIEQLHLPAKLGPLVVVVLTLPLTFLMSRWMITASFGRLRAHVSGAVVRCVHVLRKRSNTSTTLKQTSSGNPSSTRLIVPEWIDCVFAAVAAFVIAMSLHSLSPLRLNVPLAYNGDATSAQYVFKSILDHGSYLQNPDVGAPFGASMYDYPIPEPTHHFLIRLLGLFSKDAFLQFNLFYLLSFATAAATAWWALRKNGIGRLQSIAGALAFSLLPYHFLRLGHVFLASYAAIPVFCHYAVQLATYRGSHVAGAPKIGWKSALAIAIASGTGVYYAFFGLLFILLGAALGFSRSRHFSPLRVGAFQAMTIVAVIVASQLPNTVFHLAEGANLLVAQRPAYASEILGLKITQLLLPTPGHRIDALDAFVGAYNTSVPDSNENQMSALGVLASAGFLIGAFALFFGDGKRSPTVRAAGAMIVAGVLYATIGGFGVIAAHLATPEIRGLNRISVFIGFFGLLALLSAVRDHVALVRRPALDAVLACVLVAIAYFDQVPVRSLSRVNEPGFRATKTFFAKVQSAIPGGTAVYELPYNYFPESPLPPSSYGLLNPYLFTEGLRWSFGEMRGRPGDVWNEQASTLRGEEFAQALARAGYGAVYVDRIGYADKGVAIEKELRAEFGAPIVEDAALGRALYKIGPANSMSVPLIVADLGRGWLPWRHTTSGEVAWSTGDADLVVANPNGAVVPFSARFKLASYVARKVTIAYGAQVLSAVQLEPSKPMDLTVSFDAQAGVSRLSLSTDRPAAPADTSAKASTAFSITHLSYASGGALPHQ